MPPAERASVASAASVLDAFQVEQLTATAAELPPGWVVTIRARDRQIAIHPLDLADAWDWEVLVDPEHRVLYAGVGWQARHRRAALVKAGLARPDGERRGGTHRSAA